MNPSATGVDEPRWWLLGGWLGPPVLWLMQLPLSFALVPYACAKGHVYLVYISTLASLLLVAVSGALLYRRGWPAAHGIPAASAEAADGAMTPLANQPRRGRKVFIAMVAILICVQFSLVLLAQALAVVLLDPCQ